MKKTRIKKIIILLLLIIVLIPLLSILSFFLYSLKLDLSGAETLRYLGEIVLTEPKTFVSIDNAVSVEVPFTWTTYPGKKENEIIRLANIDFDEYLVVIPYVKKKIIYSSLDKVTETVVRTIKQKVKSPNISAYKIIEINNCKASLFFVDGVVDNEQLAYTHYIIDTKEALYHFIFTTNPENKKYANKIFKEIVESFKLLPKKEVQKQLEPTETEQK